MPSTNTFEAFEDCLKCFGKEWTPLKQWEGLIGVKNAKTTKNGQKRDHELPASLKWFKINVIRQFHHFAPIRFPFEVILQLNLTTDQTLY